MSLRNTAKVTRAPGRLVANPTDADFTGSFPYGGTELGWSASVTLRRMTEDFSILAEEFGSVPVEVIEAGEFWIAGAFLRAWDPDAIGHIFKTTRTGARTARPVVRMAHAPTGGRRAGQRASDRSLKLLFVPEAPFHGQAWIAYRAVALFDVAAALEFSRESELGPRIIVACLPDTSAELKAGELGPLVDLAAS